jgi:hypothetical protein
MAGGKNKNGFWAGPLVLAQKKFSEFNRGDSLQLWLQ